MPWRRAWRRRARRHPPDRARVSRRPRRCGRLRSRGFATPRRSRRGQRASPMTDSAAPTMLMTASVQLRSPVEASTMLPIAFTIAAMPATQQRGRERLSDDGDPRHGEGEHSGDGRHPACDVGDHSEGVGAPVVPPRVLQSVFAGRIADAVDRILRRGVAHRLRVSDALLRFRDPRAGVCRVGGRAVDEAFVAQDVGGVRRACREAQVAALTVSRRRPRPRARSERCRARRATRSARRQSARVGTAWRPSRGRLAIPLLSNASVSLGSIAEGSIK